MSRIDPKAAALAVGVLWGAGVAIVALTATAGWGQAWIPLLASLYIGYEAGVVGAVVGAVWGFVDGAVGAYVAAWLYNRSADAL